jgi:VIT1/CCC1 family predicted Fe2+/Mn2+ transporter
MNAGKISGILAIIFGVFTILTAIYAVATRGNAGASVVLMVITLGILAFYRSRKI